MKHIAIFGSGGGSNARVLVNHFRGHGKVRVSFLLTNNANSGLLQIAKEERMFGALVTTAGLNDENAMLNLLRLREVDMIVLAGFLQHVPKFMTDNFPKRIINIHPALLPKFGGKGMWGMNVHRAVIDNKEKESGITIHYVNEVYDDGEVILQERLLVEANDTPETLAARVLALEHQHYAKVIERLLA